ncbi:MAG: double-strand break repair helicase AddA [Pseudomonadota bacterium]
MRIDRPSPAQAEASDPAKNAWVGANAGSGKTRVLTQRVARLLLAGASPARILCLTYTKAAAAEMQNRLFQMLGTWAMAPDDALSEQLRALSDGQGPSPTQLGQARRLFAEALETPGGLKIQTIHAFCDTLLRRFPLEAGVSPRFEVIDDRQVALLSDAIREQLALAAEISPGAAFDRIAGRLNEAGIGDLVNAVMAARSGFPDRPVEKAIAEVLGSVALGDPTSLRAAAVATLDRQVLAHLADQLSDSGSKADAGLAQTIALALDAPDPTATATHLLAGLLTQKGEVRSRRGLPTKAVLSRHPEAAETVDLLLAWAAGLTDAERRANAALRARDLDAFARAFLAAYGAAKADRALLDFDDLIERAEALLTRSDMAAWALWKLDGGIDHILVDEAQDTAPRQWAVIKAIAKEFHAGQGARDLTRTLFVVGDEKQSIYSFQGADPASFGESRAELGDWLTGMGQTLARPALETSYRSAPGILDFVDTVFEDGAGEGLTVSGDPIRHRAHRADDGAWVDLWPLVTSERAEQDRDWWRPVDQVAPGHAKTRLAKTLAAEIARMIAEEQLPPRADGPARPVTPGDILVLVARRDALANGLIRALKAQGVPVAGADRLSLSAELAVQDLLALAKIALTPSDDLTLAALLRSPLCEVSEEALFTLAHGREGARLWDRVQASEAHPEVAAMLSDMAGQADFLRPFEFLERALIRHDGRRRLIARLGPEAEDPVDELLAQALAFEGRAVPSLAGFVQWIEAGSVTVKREMDQADGQVRVMTVHGAKGLEAPVVILPDTMARPVGRGGALLLQAPGDTPLTLWPEAQNEDDAVTAAAREAAAARQKGEHRRLLYVALTRAEDWLILAGAGEPSRRRGTWFEMLSDAMERAGAPAVAPPPGLEGEAFRLLTGRSAAGQAPRQKPLAASIHEPPAWLCPALPEERPRRRSPSDLGSHTAAGGERTPQDALALGNAVHLLLEHLPRDAETARALLSRAMPHLQIGLAETAVRQALAVLSTPFAAEIFGSNSLAEVTLRLDLPGFEAGMVGRADRVLLQVDGIQVIDFKSDSSPPSSPAAVPVAYLAQLGAYRAALAQLYPDRGVSGAILWTETAVLMPIPSDLLGNALAAHAGPLDSDLSPP